MEELRLFKVQKISIQMHCGSHDGGQKNAHQPIFPYNIIENSQTSLAHNSVLIVPNNFKFGTETCCMVLKPKSKLRQIDHNLHNHIFDDAICKPLGNGLTSSHMFIANIPAYVHI